MEIIKFKTKNDKKQSMWNAQQVGRALRSGPTSIYQYNYVDLIDNLFPNHRTQPAFDLYNYGTSAASGPINLRDWLPPADYKPLPFVPTSGASPDFQFRLDWAQFISRKSLCEMYGVNWGA